jgi:hypothetical protein
VEPELLERLGAFGWKVGERLTPEPGGWADALWRVESLWAPVGAQCFLVALTDPMFEGFRTPGEGLWALSARAQRPRNRIEADGGLFLKLARGWDQRLADFVRGLRQFRAPR